MNSLSATEPDSHLSTRCSTTGDELPLCIRRTAHHRRTAWWSDEIVDLSGLGRLLGGSALTDTSVGVPDGHYTDESMRVTAVPTRNAIMLSVAAGVAVAAKADTVAFGAHAGDHTIYPDCRPGFLEQLARTIRVGNEGFLVEDFQLVAPFLTVTKTDIVTAAAEMGVPFELTWSCYKGGDVHCGTCGTCWERREAFERAGITDPTRYAAAPTRER
ncbi:7-cyano-7-deazaguanine synthase [Streptomyces bluensis]|uniref:7-cyano-7-deazaguanine synthase n=1 Tax=Streptomyces bluensis TaxID=33897 RepID=UPI001E38089D|nr:7-cyano-7-deazaguanine synthase [Streptomyces bluensis]